MTGQDSTEETVSYDTRRHALIVAFPVRHRDDDGHAYLGMPSIVSATNDTWAIAAALEQAAAAIRADSHGYGFERLP